MTDDRPVLATDETLARVALCMVSGKKKQRVYVLEETAKLGLNLNDFVRATPAAKAVSDLALRAILFGIDF